MEANELHKKHLIGMITVDSGQVLVVDPAYVLDGDVNQPDTPYADAVAASSKPKHGGATILLPCLPDQEHKATVAATRHGDGVFPVYMLEHTDGRRGLYIPFDEEVGIREDEPDSYQAAWGPLTKAERKQRICIRSGNTIRQLGLPIKALF